MFHLDPLNVARRSGADGSHRLRPPTRGHIGKEAVAWTLVLMVLHRTTTARSLWLVTLPDLRAVSRSGVAPTRPQLPPGKRSLRRRTTKEGPGWHETPVAVGPGSRLRDAKPPTAGTSKSVHCRRTTRNEKASFPGKVPFRFSARIAA